MNDRNGTRNIFQDFTNKKLNEMEERIVEFVDGIFIFEK